MSEHQDKRFGAWAEDDVVKNSKWYGSNHITHHSTVRVVEVLNFDEKIVGYVTPVHKGLVLWARMTYFLKRFHLTFKPKELE